jgi:hypothetical protein
LQWSSDRAFRVGSNQTLARIQPDAQVHGMWRAGARTVHLTKICPDLTITSSPPRPTRVISRVGEGLSAKLGTSCRLSGRTDSPRFRTIQDRPKDIKG